MVNGMNQICCTLVQVPGARTGRTCGLSHPSEIPFIFSFFLIVIAKISTAIMNNNADNGHP